jgi:hypothetical protein
VIAGSPISRKRDLSQHDCSIEELGFVIFVKIAVMTYLRKGKIVMTVIMDRKTFVAAGTAVSSATRERMCGIDALRYIAIFGVILIHTYPEATCSDPGGILLAYPVNAHTH